MDSPPAERAGINRYFDIKVPKTAGKTNWSLSNLVALLKMNLFVKSNLQYWLDKPYHPLDKPPKSAKIALGW